MLHRISIYIALFLRGEKHVTLPVSFGDVTGRPASAPLQTQMTEEDRVLYLAQKREAGVVLI